VIAHEEAVTVCASGYEVIHEPRVSTAGTMSDENKGTTMTKENGSLRFLESLPDWLRWILVYPVAGLALIPITIVASLIVGGPILNPDPVTSWGEFIGPEIVFIIITFAFIWISAFVAPRHNGIVAWVSASMIMVVSGVVVALLIVALVNEGGSFSNVSFFTWVETLATLLIRFAAPMVAAIIVQDAFGGNKHGTKK
jgi:hypothetical protein